MARIPEGPGSERGRSLLLRKTREQARLEGLDARGWSDDDYAVLIPEGANGNARDARVGRIYRELIHGRPMWRWVISTGAAPVQGVAETLREAEEDLKRRYPEVSRNGSDRNGSGR